MLHGWAVVPGSKMLLRTVQSTCNQQGIRQNSVGRLSTLFYDLRNDEILDCVTMHDLPIFIGIDGGSLKDDCATVSICIVAPNILLTDYDNEWHSRPAKTLLIRTWKLLKQWGTSQTCINMAETLGFIIGEYSIPSDLPIIYITDSNNVLYKGT